MRYKIFTGFFALVLACMPVAASAANTSDPKLAALVQELNQVLDKLNELDTAHAHIRILPAYGDAPFTTLFFLSATSSTEALDFGDGHSTGSLGCVKNQYGFCALPAVIGHTYALPGLYKVTLYDHPGKNAKTPRIIEQTFVYTW